MEASTPFSITPNGELSFQNHRSIGSIFRLVCSRTFVSDCFQRELAETSVQELQQELPVFSKVTTTKFVVEEDVQPPSPPQLPAQSSALSASIQRTLETTTQPSVIPYSYSTPSVSPAPSSLSEFSMLSDDDEPSRLPYHTPTELPRALMDEMALFTFNVAMTTKRSILRTLGVAPIIAFAPQYHNTEHCDPSELSCSVCVDDFFSSDRFFGMARVHPELRITPARDAVEKTQGRLYRSAVASYPVIPFKPCYFEFLIEAAGEGRGGASFGLSSFCHPLEVMVGATGASIGLHTFGSVAHSDSMTAYTNNPFISPAMPPLCSSPCLQPPLTAAEVTASIASPTWSRGSRSSRRTAASSVSVSETALPIGTVIGTLAMQVMLPSKDGKLISIILVSYSLNGRTLIPPEQSVTTKEGLDELLNDVDLDGFLPMQTPSLPSPHATTQHPPPHGRRGTLTSLVNPHEVEFHPLTRETLDFAAKGPVDRSGKFKRGQPSQDRPPTRPFFSSSTAYSIPQTSASNHPHTTRDVTSLLYDLLGDPNNGFSAFQTVNKGMLRPALSIYKNGMRVRSLLEPDEIMFTSHLGVRAWTVGGTQLVSPLTNKESKHPLARAIFMSQSAVEPQIQLRLPQQFVKQNYDLPALTL